MKIRPKRKPLRLPYFDYSQNGAYFVTICIKNRECLLGKISNGEMLLNYLGEIVLQSWLDLPNHYPLIEIDEFTVMPNHCHGVIVMTDVGAGLKPAPTKPPLSEIIRGFKTFSARKINLFRRLPGRPVWQRNFYEHVIRDEKSLNRIREYISTNPRRWELDRENPQMTGKDEFDDWLAKYKGSPLKRCNC
ncbi:MAG: transposase [Deltaproteobacteria bacterium]|nr:transposase [Deltaproteobacteria bacterium]